MSDGEDRTTEFNSALFALERVDTIKKACHEARFEERFKDWIKHLYGYFSEVSPQMTFKQKQEYLKSLRAARSALDIPGGINKEMYGDALYDLLFQIELDLEDFFDLKGNKFKYGERQQEIDLSNFGENLEKLREDLGLGEHWSKKDPKDLVKGSSEGGD